MIKAKHANTITNQRFLSGCLSFSCIEGDNWLRGISDWTDALLKTLCGDLNWWLTTVFTGGDSAGEVAIVSTGFAEA
jgi:hypothetical protein